MTAYSKRRKDIIRNLEAEAIELMSAFMNANSDQERATAFRKLNSLSKMIVVIDRIDRHLDGSDKIENPEAFVLYGAEEKA